MGKVKVLIPKVVFTIIVCFMIFFTINNLTNIHVDANGTNYLLNEKSKAYYEKVSSNSCITNINGVSNIRINLLKDGYTLYNEDISKDFIDMSYVKQGYPTFRYIFDVSRSILTVFSSTYENSIIGLTYIIEEG